MKQQTSKQTIFCNSRLNVLYFFIKCCCTNKWINKQTHSFVCVCVSKAAYIDSSCGYVLKVLMSQRTNKQKMNQSINQHTNKLISMCLSCGQQLNKCFKSAIAPTNKWTNKWANKQIIFITANEWINRWMSEQISNCVSKAAEKLQDRCS